MAVLANPGQYENFNVEVVGKVFNIVPSKAGQFVFQIYTDPAKSAGNTIVATADTALQTTVVKDSYVRVGGTLGSPLDYTNVAGGSVTAPLILARAIEVVTRADAVPAVKALDVGQTVSQYGLSITLQKVEIAGTETRVYIHAVNGSASKASLYTFEAVLVQGTRQIKEAGSFDTRDLQPQDSLLAGTETTGIIFLGPLDPAAGALRFVWSGPRTDDYTADFADWNWDLTIP